MVVYEGVSVSMSTTLFYLALVGWVIKIGFWVAGGLAVSAVVIWVKAK